MTIPGVDIVVALDTITRTVPVVRSLVPFSAPMIDVTIAASIRSYAATPQKLQPLFVQRMKRISPAAQRQQ
jgi:hypothetical protein